MKHKKTKLGLLGLGTAIGAISVWNAYRNHKYPVDKEYRLFNKFFFPPCMVTQSVITKSNEMIRSMKHSPLPEGIAKEIKWIKSEGNASVQLTIYKPEIKEHVNIHEEQENHNDVENEKLPCLIYYHGGGFFFEDAWYIHENVAEYAKKANCQVVFVHYRTADVAPFPTPFLDCCNALQYVWDNCETLGIDKNRIAVGGDSAGGALAAACTLWARDEAKIPLCFQMLIYPVTDCRMETESMKKYVDGPTWNSRLNKKMWEVYLRGGDYTQKYADQLQYAAPMLAEHFENLPPAYVEVQEFDCLRDEGIAYAQALVVAGNAVQLEEVKGTVHGFDVLEYTAKTKEMKQIREKALYDAFWAESFTKA